MTLRRQTGLRPGNTRLLALLIFAWPIGASGQNPQLQTSVGAQFPTVVFTSVFWKADPPYYSIAIDSTGIATYQSAPDQVTSTGVPYTIEFRVSDRTRRMTFNIAQRLNFFAEPIRDVPGSPDNVAVMTLTYGDFHSHNQITYSKSPNSDIDELTSLFEEVSQTLEFGRRLAYFHQHDRNLLDRELDFMQKSASSRRLREIDVISNVLKRIATDKSLGAGTRRKAEELLAAPPRS